MSADENIQLMRRWFQEVWNEGRIETVHELFAPDGVARGQRGAESEIRGPEEFAKFVREIRGAFPDITSAIAAWKSASVLPAPSLKIDAWCSSFPWFTSRNVVRPAASVSGP